DAAIGFSRDTERFFALRGVPWHWMPGGVTAEGGCPEADRPASGPLTFAYFGALAEHAGILPLIEAFLASGVPGHLHICGHGQLGPIITTIAARSENLHFHGLLATPDDCVAWARKFDVLVNPRPATWGNENNFPSKVFQYALAGRAILTTRLSGVEHVLGPGAVVIEPDPLVDNLKQAILATAQTDRIELRRRGEEIRQRVLGNYSWRRQARRVARFLERVAGGQAH
ncbi:MAG: glycosyltransferase, partial [Verrucomicrobiae bacterium]|nr:glycosyltransferase [Verrucomicrobiae bacterium]